VTVGPSCRTTVTTEVPGQDDIPGPGQTRVDLPRQPGAVRARQRPWRRASIDCACLDPPDVNAAVGTTQIVEATNIRLAAYNKTGVLQCNAISIASLLGASDGLSDPARAIRQHQRPVQPVDHRASRLRYRQAGAL